MNNHVSEDEKKEDADHDAYYQYDEYEKQIRLRHLWNLGSSVRVYSRSKDKWFDGQIIDIYIETLTNKEWFIVKYNGNQKKSMQRFNKDIKPKNFVSYPMANNTNMNNTKILKLDEMMPEWAHNQKTNLTCASFATTCVIDYLLENEHDIRVHRDKLSEKVEEIMDEKSSFPHLIIDKINEKQIIIPDCDKGKRYKLTLGSNSVTFLANYAQSLSIPLVQFEDNKEGNKEMGHIILRNIDWYRKYLDRPITGAYKSDDQATFGGNDHENHAVAVFKTKHGKVICTNSWGNAYPIKRINPTDFYYFSEIFITKIFELDPDSGKEGYQQIYSSDDNEIREGIYYILDEATNCALSVEHSSTKSGKKMMAEAFRDYKSLRQRNFFIIEPDKNESTSHIYYIKALTSEKYLEITNKADGSQVVQQPFEDKAMQKWEISVYSKEKSIYTIKNVDSDKFVQFKDNGLKQYSTKQPLKFKIINAVYDMYAFQKQN